MIPIPTEDDWENYQDDLDAKYAHKIFFGKTNNEVQEDFKRSVIERASELSFMPIKPFQYYVLGFKQFIEIRDFNQFDDADAASCFIRLVESMLTKKRNFIKPVLNELMPTVRHIAENQSAYDADEQIYGSFKEIYQNIQKLAKSA